MRDADAKLGCLRVKHLNGGLGSNLLAEAILGFKDGPVDTFLQLKVELGLSAFIGGKALLGDDLAQFPGVYIGCIRCSDEFWCEAAIAHRHDVAPVVIEFRPLNVIWLIKGVNLQGAFHLLADAIEGGGIEVDGNRFILGLPVGG